MKNKAHHRGIPATLISGDGIDTAANISSCHWIR
jgi:hypothetical protein